MRCPYCAHPDSQVKDSRSSEDNAAVKRRRVCPECGGKFTTFERVQLRDLTVLKRSGRRVPFDRDKLYKSVEIATRKREISDERLEKMVSALVRQFESLGEDELTTDKIGRAVMENLKQLDDVAYVRFASVYHNFGDADAFKSFLGEMTSE
jgi:transcriptional repressor NrdR